MPDATPAIVFLLMLIAPCAIALLGDRGKSQEGSAAPAGAKTKATPEPKLPITSMERPAHSVPMLTPPPAIEVREAFVSTAYTQPPRLYTQGPDPYAEAARLYGQPESLFVQPYAKAQQRPREVAPPHSVAQSMVHTQSALSLRQAAEQAETEALQAQAVAVKAHAAALAAAARAAQAKANAAAELANQAAREAEVAHRAADYERDMQAQITAQEQAHTVHGEHHLPESHPSLNFPRSGRGRRAV